jgi:hypothetical protein
VCIASLTQFETFATGCVSPIQTNHSGPWWGQTNKQTHKQTESQTRQGHLSTPAVYRAVERLVYQMPVQGRRTTLLDAITQAHSTAHMQQNATRIIPLPNSLLPGTCFFIHLWTFTSSTVSQSVFWVLFVDLFFSLQPSIGGIWIYFGTCIFQSLVELALTHFLGFFHRELTRLRGWHFGGPPSRA